MPQLARPIADVSNTGWTPTPVFAEINEAVADDSTLVSTGLNPQGASFEVDFPFLAMPRDPPSVSPYTLSVRLRQTGSGSLAVKVSLLEGSNVIGSWVLQLSQLFTTVNFNLSQAQVNQIRDYLDLRLEVTADLPLVTCCPDPLPAILYATFSNGPACLNGVRFPLAYSNGTWAGSYGPVCSMTEWDGFGLSCSGSTWQMAHTNLNCVSPVFLYPTSTNCSPFQLTFNNVALGPGCGGGTCTITVTS